MSKLIKNYALLALALLAAPSLAFAQGEIFENFAEFISAFGGLVALLVPILIAVAVLVLIFNVVKFIVKSGDAEARKEASRSIIFSIIGIFVIVSLFGLVRILQKAFGVERDNVVDQDDVPTIQYDEILDRQ